MSPTKKRKKKLIANFEENKDKWVQLRLYQCKKSQGLCKLQVFLQTKGYLQYLRNILTKSVRIASNDINLSQTVMHIALRNK